MRDGGGVVKEEGEGAPKEGGRRRKVRSPRRRIYRDARVVRQICSMKLACRAVACASARLRLTGFGATASARFASAGWWAVTGSNCRPSRCKRDALPTELTVLSCTPPHSLPKAFPNAIRT